MNSEDMRTGSDTNSACLRGLRTRDVPTGTLWTLRLKQAGYRGIGARAGASRLSTRNQISAL